MTEITDVDFLELFFDTGPVEYNIYDVRRSATHFEFTVHSPDQGDVATQRHYTLNYFESLKAAAVPWSDSFAAYLLRLLWIRYKLDMPPPAMADVFALVSNVLAYIGYQGIKIETIKKGLGTLLQKHKKCLRKVSGRCQTSNATFENAWTEVYLLTPKGERYAERMVETKSEPKWQPTSETQGQRKKKSSKYEDAVEERLHNLKNGVLQGEISVKIAMKQVSIKAFAKHFKENSELFGDAKIDTIEQYVGRSKAWKNRHHILQEVDGTKPPSISEAYDIRTYRDGVSEINCDRERYEEHVEAFLVKFRREALLKKTDIVLYNSAARNLSPKSVAGHLKTLEPFKKTDITSIETGIKHSNAWRNRRETLEIPAVDMHE